MPNELIFPFRRKEDLALEVGHPRDLASQKKLEGVAIPEAEPYGPTQIDIADVPTGWDALEFEVTFKIPKDELCALLRAGETATEVTRALVSVTCSGAKLRQGFELAFDNEETWYGKVVVRRSDVRGIVRLVPEVVRMTDAPNGSKSTAARFGGAVVATGPEVLLVVDRFARSYDGPIQYKWGKFAESDNSWIAGRADDVFFLDPNDVPRLHLNLRWNSLQPILKSSARTGSQAALKNAYAATITQCVWTQMLMVAVATITLDRETGDGVAASGWRGQLAKMIAGELYPDKTVGEALQILHANLRSAETAPTLIGQLGSLAHDRSSVGPLLEKAAQWMREREKPDQTDL